MSVETALPAAAESYRPLSMQRESVLLPNEVRLAGMIEIWASLSILLKKLPDVLQKPPAQGVADSRMHVQGC